ncbi:MAG: DNA polymerase domain-containing protein [Nitrososphaeria archaeon]|jgi:DNA polymerase elongation subunit (family B)
MDIRRTTWVEKYTNLREEKKKRLIHVVVEDALAYRQIVGALKRQEQVMELFNIDLLHLQQYLFTRFQIEPTSKVEFLYDTNWCLSEIRKVNDSKEIEPPHFTTLHFGINIGATSLTPNPQTDPITSIETRFEDKETLIEGSEEEVLKGFESIVKEKDPDFIVTQNCDKFTFPYLQTRARSLNIKMQLRREDVDSDSFNRSLPYCMRGRVAIGYESYGILHDKWGIAGLVERSRFGFLTPGLAARWSANRVNDSRVCYELLQRDYVIPKNTGYYEYIRPMKEIFERDRGGMIIPPKIGEVHANVAELDYESEYPNLIVKECISFETVGPKGLDKRDDAILPLVTGKVLERRLYFKRLRKSFPKQSKEWLWCEQRQSALKMVLVCIYGTSGCCWNRFGNVLAFEEINRKSRQVMIRTKDYVQSQGFELIYADTDSVFVKKDDATKEDYEQLAAQLSKFIGLPISLDHHYRFLLLLPLEADPSLNMEAQKHYFGVLYDGELIVRGIELRRHDTPSFIKEFQAKLIQTLFDCTTVEEVCNVGYERAMLLITRTIDKIMGGDIPFEELVVSKTLRKTVNKYRSVLPHVAAAIQLASKGKQVKSGEDINFIYMDSDHHNPLCRVIPLELASSHVNIDKEKYRDMLLDAAETVLSTFSFSREAYGIP